MCGICGTMGARIGREQLEHATNMMRHRGPDEAGYFLDGDVAMGMRRLSIIDLEGGSQPKTNEDGTIQVIFNGEIYNHRELRAELSGDGHAFTSHSDTEVIVHAFEQWGMDCFSRLNGIFAIAIWDSRREQMILARDHLGVKPLFYSFQGPRLVFGSELKPLLDLLPTMAAIDPASAALYFRYQYVPAPRSIFAGVYKLPPAHYLIAQHGQSASDPVRFWDPLAAAARKHAVISAEEAGDLLDDALAAAVKRQMVSDVPLGAFLSGGVDSSLVVALMQRASNRAVKTFSIGFQEETEDESVYAAEVARHLGTEHFSWTITHEDALDVVPKLPLYFDEPFADSSAIPTFLVSQLARQHVTVSLSGDGGDELFGGYSRYTLLGRAREWWALPAPLRRAGLAAAGGVPGPAGRRFRRIAPILSASSLSDAYRNLISITPDSTLTRLTGHSYFPDEEWPSHHFAGRSLNEAMMLTDLVTYLPDDILTKVDRASMAHSLEARVPLLDVPAVELALSLPVSIRMGQGQKALLKGVLARYVPRRMIDRPKHGFGIPREEWLRGGLRQCLIDYLSPVALDRHGLLRPDVVQHLLHEHLTDKVNRGSTLWAILMFQIWYEQMYTGLDQGWEPNVLDCAVG